MDGIILGLFSAFTGMVIILLIEFFAGSKLHI